MVAASSEHSREEGMSKLIPIVRSTMPAHIVQAPSNTLSKEARKSIGAGVYVKRKKHEHEALPRTTDWRKGEPYKTGDGDHTAQVPRAGSLVAFSLPSRGNRT
jgi:hypothetical protein